MSNDSGSRIWVGDLDAYIDIDGINAANEREAEQAELEIELKEIGEIPLFAGRATSARQLHGRGVTPCDWRHAVHQAEMVIGRERDIRAHQSVHGPEGLEHRFVRTMLDLGRAYAIARYARWECLDYPSAITATLPHGIRALLNQFLAAEGITRSANTDARIRSILTGSLTNQMTAYRRTGLMQTTLHSIADEAWGHAGGASFDRDRARTILALSRLHFCGLELRMSSVKEIASLDANYVVDRDALGPNRELLIEGRRSIRNWRLRHLHSLLELYPYAIRYGLARAARSAELDRVASINELALAHCGVRRMRSTGHYRPRSR
jgi:hypothetical protein